jgi:hypothetical protein
MTARALAGRRSQAKRVVAILLSRSASEFVLPYSSY